MSKSKKPEATLRRALPLLLVAAILSAGAILLPNIYQAKLGNSIHAAAPSSNRNTETIVNNKGNNPKVVCADIYNPVCGSDGITYPNSCEASLAKITKYTLGECEEPTITPIAN